MKEAEQLDSYVKSYTSGFPYSEENHLMLATCGECVARYIRKAGFKIDKTEGLFLKLFTTAQLGGLNLSPPFGSY